MMICVWSWVGEVDDALKKDTRFIFKPNPDTDPKSKREEIEVEFDSIDLVKLSEDFDVMIIQRSRMILCLDVRGKMFRQR